MGTNVQRTLSTPDYLGATPPGAYGSPATPMTYNRYFSSLRIAVRAVIERPKRPNIRYGGGYFGIQLLSKYVPSTTLFTYCLSKRLKDTLPLLIPSVHSTSTNTLLHFDYIYVRPSQDGCTYLRMPRNDHSNNNGSLWAADAST